MFIPVPHNQAETIPSPDLRVLRRARDATMDTRIHRIGEYGAILFRAVLLLNCGIEMLVSQTTPLLMVALVITSGALIAGGTFTMPAWMLLVADGAAVGALILATGSSASPLLLLVPALVVQGSLFAEERDALVGAGIGITLLLLVGCVSIWGHWVQRGCW